MPLTLATSGWRVIAADNEVIAGKKLIVDHSKSEGRNGHCYDNRRGDEPPPGRYLLVAQYGHPPATAATDVARVIRSVAVALSPSLDMGVAAVLSFGVHDGIHGSCQPPHSAAKPSAAVGPHEPGL